MSQVEILLVEDDVHDVDLALRSFRKSNVARNIEVARDGAQALEMLFPADTTAPLRPRLVLLDLKLPKINGLEVLKRIRNEESTRLLPVVILTSSKESSDLRKAYELGANSYLCKPVEFAAFDQVLTSVGLYWMTLNENAP